MCDDALLPRTIEGVLLAIFTILGGRGEVKEVAVALEGAGTFVLAALVLAVLAAEVLAAEVADGVGETMLVRLRLNLEEVLTTVGGASAFLFRSILLL